MISQVDALLELGLDQFGYTFLTIDDFWQLPERDPETGMMVADPDKFPDGIKHLSDYMHSRGLQIGIYSSAGRYTCSGNLNIQRLSPFWSLLSQSVSSPSLLSPLSV